MRVLVRAFSLGILLIVSHGSALFADPILIADARRVSASARIDGNSPAPNLQTPAAPFVPFVGLASQSAADGVISARTVTTQRSTFGTRVFSASGTVDSTATGDGIGEGFDSFATGSSLFDVEFDLAAPHRFSLTGLIAVDRVEAFPGAGGFGEVDVFLTSELSSGDVGVIVDGLRFGSKQLDAAGILPKGRHRLFVEASTESVSAGDLTRHTPRFDIEFGVTPTPEPGSLVLIGGGLLALASKRLRAR